MFRQFLHAISVFLTVLRYWVKATFTETAIKTKFVDRFFLNFFCTLIDQCTIKSPNFLSIENFWSRLTWAQKWVNIEAMSYIRLSFCSGTSIVSSLAQHQIATQQARIYRTWLPSEIYSPILQNYHISERFQRATKRDKFLRTAWEFDVVLSRERVKT